MSTGFRSLLALLLLLACLPLPPAAAAPALQRSVSPCAAAIAAAEDAQHLPPNLLQAIARVESGRPDPVTGRLQPWPWTINAQGQGAFFASKAEAIAAVQALQARGVHSIDAGCMQINLMFHSTAFASLDEAFDPGANARYAARFLISLRGNSRDWDNAIGAYHSQTLALAEDYRRRVLALWQDPGEPGWHLGLAVAYSDFAPRSAAYGDFLPKSLVYGAFAPPGADPYAALRR